MKGKWSTWSPGRFPIPENDEDFAPVVVETMKASAPRPEVAGGFQHPAMPKGRKVNMTCGNCQLICHPEEDERKRRYKLLTGNGVVVQHPDGTLQAASTRAISAATRAGKRRSRFISRPLDRLGEASRLVIPWACSNLRRGG